MNARTLIAALACLGGLGAGCISPSDSSVRLLGAQPLSVACTPGSVDLIGGSLDVAGGQAALAQAVRPADVLGYVAQFKLESDLGDHELKSEDGVLQDSSGNTFIVDQAEFAYSSKPEIAFEKETANLYMVIQAGSAGGSFIRLNLLQPKAAKKLLESVTPDKSLDLKVALTIKGHLTSGQTLSTNTVGFPIEVFHSGFQACPTGQVLAANGICGGIGGQDGTAPVCTPGK